MKLVDLEPRWIGPDTFAFRCPHCPREVDRWLTCTLRPIPSDEQSAAIDAAFGEDNSHKVSECNPNHGWSATTRDFATMTVKPSINMGEHHWHGFITNGEIR